MPTVRDRRATSPRAKVVKATASQASNKGPAPPVSIPWMLSAYSEDAFQTELLLTAPTKPVKRRAPPSKRAAAPAVRKRKSPATAARKPRLVAPAMPAPVESAPVEPVVPAQHSALAEIERTPALPLPPAVAFAPPDTSPLPLAPETPIPRERALTVRRQGLLDSLSQALIEAGVRLARWTARRRRADEERGRIRQAVARHRAMVGQLEALQALRERVKAAK